MGNILLNDNINWKDLRKQKQTLVQLSIKYNAIGDVITSENLEGVISLIDEIQDEALSAGFTEEEVFGKECPNCGCTLKPVMVDTDGTNLEEGFECPECDK